jgi:hypothetical protein
VTESITQKIRMLSRSSYGVRSVETIIAIVKLSPSGLCPPVLDRS